MHGVLLWPPVNRLREDPEVFIETDPARFVRRGCLGRLHAEPITHDLPRVLRYVEKSVRRGQADLDQMLVFPRSASEVRRGPDRRVGRSASIYGADHGIPRDAPRDRRAGAPHRGRPRLWDEADGRIRRGDAPNEPGEAVWL